MNIKRIGSKKPAIERLVSLVISLVVIGMVITIGLLVMAETKSQVQAKDSVNSTCQNSAGTYTSGACNGTSDTIAE